MTSNLVVELTDSKTIIKFAVLFNNLKNMFVETNMYFNDTGLYLQAMDSSQICCCELKLNKSWFSKYCIEKDVVIGINLETFDKILSCLDRKLKLYLSYNDNDTFTIKLSDDNITKIYQMALIEIDTAVLQIPTVEYTADIEMVSNSCRNYINELSLFGEELTVMCNQENVILKSSGDGNTSVIIIKDECLEVYAIEEDADISCKYDIKLIKLITNFVKLSKVITIGVSTTMPLSMVYKLDEEAENTLKFYIAPKIEDEY